MAEKTGTGVLAKYKAALDAAKLKYREINTENKQLALVARKNAQVAKQTQDLAIDASQQNASLLAGHMGQNSRAAVASTIYLASIVGASVELGSNAFIHWLAAPAKDATAPNIVLRNLGFFEALPGLFFGSVVGGISIYRAGQRAKQYGAGDEFMRNLATGLNMVGMVRGGDALLKPMPGPKQ